MISILSCIILEARSLALRNVHVFSVTHFRPRIPVTSVMMTNRYSAGGRIGHCIALVTDDCPNCCG